MSLSLYDTITGVKLKTLGGHNDLIYTLSFNNDGSLIVSAGEDNFIKIWDLATG